MSESVSRAPQTLESVEEIADILRQVINDAVEKLADRKTKKISMLRGPRNIAIPDSEGIGIIVREGLTALNDIKVEGMTPKQAMDAALTLVAGERRVLPKDAPDRNMYEITCSFAYGDKIPTLRIGKIDYSNTALTRIQKMPLEEAESAQLQAQLENPHKPPLAIWHAGVSDMTYTGNVFSVGHCREGAKIHIVEVPTREAEMDLTDGSIIDVVDDRGREGEIEDRALQVYKEMLWTWNGNHEIAIATTISVLQLFRTNYAEMAVEFKEQFPNDNPRDFMETAEYILAHQGKMIELARLSKGRIDARFAEEMGFMARVQATMLDPDSEPNIHLDLSGLEKN